MVCAHLQRLVSSHNQSRLAVLLVLQKSNIARAALLPLVRILDKFEEFRTHLKYLVLKLLIRPDLHLFRQADYRLEVHVLGFGDLIL